VLLMVKCAVVRLRALMARHSARLITKHPIPGYCFFKKKHPIAFMVNIYDMSVCRQIDPTCFPLNSLDAVPRNPIEQMKK
jgi:hypothetical protein